VGRLAGSGCGAGRDRRRAVRVSLELRESAVTAVADVVFPVAPVVEKAGAFVNWEGRVRPFNPALQTNAIPDLRVLAYLADELAST